jgi:hypothetical protein
MPAPSRYLAYFDLDLFFSDKKTSVQSVNEFWTVLNSSLDNIFKTEPKIRSVPPNDKFDDVPYLQITEGAYKLNISREKVEFIFSSDDKVTYEDSKTMLIKQLLTLQKNLLSKNKQFGQIGAAIGYFYPINDPAKSIEKLFVKPAMYFIGGTELGRMDVRLTAKNRYEDQDVHDLVQIRLAQSPYKSEGILYVFSRHTIDNKEQDLSIEKFIDELEKSIKLKSFEELVWP